MLCKYYFVALVKSYFLAMDENNLSSKDERGKRLKEARTYLSLTQEEFGAKIGLKWSQVKDRESGIANIKRVLAEKIEEKMGISADWLLTGQGEMMIKSASAGKGGESATVEERQAVMRYLHHLEEENKSLKDELFRLRTGEFDRRKSGQAS
jgi:transcriptional regulator with XRE-family HTH domain